MVLLPLDGPSPSGDPPAGRESVTTAAGPGGMVDGRSDGGVAAAPLPPSEYEPSAWLELVSSFTEGGALETVNDLIDALGASPELRSAASLRTLDRLRDAMDGMSGGTNLDAKVEIKVTDLVTATRALLTRLR